MNKKYPITTFLKLFLLPLFLIPLSVNAQDKVTLSGYVKDENSGETLIGANVYVRETSNGAMTNEYGFYSVSLPPGDYNIEFSYLGYETKKELISLTEKKSMNVELAEEGIMVTEVVVVSEAEDENITTTEMSTNELKIKTITKMPALLGEADVIRSIQLLPGVSTVGEGATGFNVRGGGVDQNLVLLDEAPVYNSSHLFGFFSVFNPDAVKDVKLYKGGIPSRYGGRLSSILDVRMKEGNSKKLAVSGGVGFIFSRLAVEAPIIKDKMSFIVAGRRSYIDVLAKPFLDGGLEDTELNFYDLTFKTNYKISDKDRIYLSAYLGRDNFGFGEDAGFSWGNSTATFRWNHLFSDKLFANFTTYYSNYDYEIRFGSDDQDSFDWDAAIVNYSAKSDFSWFLNPDNLITFGGQAILYDFAPGNAVAVSGGENTDFSVEKKWALEGGLFAENEQKLNSRISLQYGLRLSYFNYMGEGTAYQFEDTEPGLRKNELPDQRERFDQWESIEDYINLEPRASVKFQVDRTSSLKASYNRMYQYIHLVSNSTASTPLDVWTPSTNNLKPQQVDQFALGYFKNWKDNNYTSSVEVYYKDFDNLLDFVNGADLFVNPLLEGELLAGRGRAYGMELQVEKTKGKFTGWFSYTLARTERKVDGINNDKWFASRFDQTHNFSTTAFYELNKRWTFSANFLFTTGTPATFPTDRIEQQGYVIPNIADNKRNNVRIPAYHRLDISATLNGKEKPGKRWNGNWVFSVYNVYNRRNPFTIFFRQPNERTGGGQPVNTEAIQFSVIGSFIPSVAYNFEF